MGVRIDHRFVGGAAGGGQDERKDDQSEWRYCLSSLYRSSTENGGSLTVHFPQSNSKVRRILCATFYRYILTCNL